MTGEKVFRQYDAVGRTVFVPSKGFINASLAIVAAAPANATERHVCVRMDGILLLFDEKSDTHKSKGTDFLPYCLPSTP